MTIDPPQLSITGKTYLWVIRSKRTRAPLAIVRWYGSWRQYCLFPYPDIVFNAECLDEISAFLRTAPKPEVPGG